MKRQAKQIGDRNWVGQNIARLRKAQRPKMSQRALADELQRGGLDLDKNAIQLIECWRRCVRDKELFLIARALHVEPGALFEGVEA